RPAFQLTVTITLELGLETPEGPPVVTKEITLSRMSTPPVEFDNWFEIGGTVRDAITLVPVPDAEVTLVETGATTVSNESGQFKFSLLEAGNYTLHVVAGGFPPQDKPVVVPGLVLNEYDVAL
ncbi:MAG TPA: carboxypeptidase-like regulatory domain-containing protein, partial [Pyrinomonadaceae bacterium]|nr:carboxypeptidase-like regulatory domain-containing protein [Pyrinomonadaceae bacterium]